MVSARSPLTVAILSMLLMFWPGDFSGQSAAPVHHKRVVQEQASDKSQAQNPTDQVEVINGSSRSLQELDGQQPNGAEQTSAGTVPGSKKVDVINGLYRRTQVFNPDNSEPCLAARHQQTGRDIRILAPQQDKNAPPKYMTVHVINGARSDQRTFEECGADEPPLQERLRQYHQRVVVSIETPEMFNRRSSAGRVVMGIATPESQRARGQANQVVVAIASSESESARAGGLPEFSVEPRPKRPPYHPAPFSPQ